MLGEVNTSTSHKYPRSIYRVNKVIKVKYKKWENTFELTEVNVELKHDKIRAGRKEFLPNLVQKKNNGEVLLCRIF